MFYVWFGVLCIFCMYYLVAGDNVTEKVKEKEMDIKDYDWEVWCKFQPNGYDCARNEEARFYYDIKMEGCKAFTYGGCPTNYNSFSTITSCHENCRDAGEHAIKFNMSDKISCRMQPDFGQCNEYQPMFYFDITRRACRGFSYSGCGGNNNRFVDAQLCNTVCSAITQF